MNFKEPHISREQIQDILFGMKPNNLENYRRALVHKSLKSQISKALANNEQVCSYYVFGKSSSSNERLEYLGDAVLNLIVGAYLFSKYPNKDEGFLTRLRIKIVRGSHCVKFSKLIGLEKYILIGSKNIINDKILEDAFEAFLGAIYLDLGYDFTNEFVVKLINKYVDLNILLEDDNYKDILMRYTQFKKIPLPVYQNEQKDKTFYSKIFLNINGIPKLFGLGHGNIIKLAEQNAAKNALNKIDKNDLLTINHN